MLYDVRGHPLLPQVAPDLSGEAIIEHVELAERALGLRGAGAPELFVTPADVADVKRYLVLQVGLQVAQDPEAFLASTVQRGIESISYRAGVMVHPVAEAGIAQLIAEQGGGTETVEGGYTIVPGFR